jgi:exodeoxyribonuclease V gamma subunit
LFSIFFSNRFESLLDALLARMEALSRQGPFARVEVIVPRKALERRIELAMADRFGIGAGVSFDYLAQWLWRQIGRVVEVPGVSPYDPDVMIWQIFAVLEGDWLKKHARLAHYLKEADARQRFELAGRLARLFDLYLCYRPQWLEKWADEKAASVSREGTLHEDEVWQAELWRRIVLKGESRTFRLPFMSFLRNVAQGADLTGAGLPAAVDVFCLPDLPPLYLNVLRALSRVMDVQLYVLNPCCEYWFDIVDARRLSWLARRRRDRFHETGNRLLAAWGKQTQAQIESLFEGENLVREEAQFTTHAGAHLLARVQNAFLDLQELEAGSIRLDECDRSIELHLCHSRIRELEVLHDRLLGLFRERKDLRPDEVVVLMPDLAACAPLIEAVFGTAPKERFIAWRITGQGGTQENPVARALDDLLTLAAGNAPASRVFDLLRQPLVAAHFGLPESALEQVRDWMREAGIRWGLDSEQAAGTGDGHTVEAGLARLFLSWAAGDAAGRAIFAGQTGIRHAPRGSAGLTLGAFWHYARILNGLRTALLQTHDAEGWRAVLLTSLTALMGDAPEHAEEMRAVCGAVNALVDDMAGGREAGGALPLDVVHLALRERLDDAAHGGVPGGAVTFSALPALRGLPYRVVCVIGLDNDAFPVRVRTDEFDLMAASPQKGDRQSRDDARNLFLDVVLAARDVLHLSCVGRSARDNAELLPSVLVDELLDALATACAENPTQPDSIVRARARLIVEHPLQSFSPEYFVAEGKKDGRLESFRGEFACALDERFCRQRDAAKKRRVTARSLEEDEDDDDAGVEECAGRPFFTSPLPPPDESWRCVDLIRLKRFFDNPCHFLLRERLELDLPSSEEELADAEPFVPDWQASRALADRLLPVLLERGEEAIDDETLFSLARAGREYPAANLGERALRRELVSLRSFADRVNMALAKSRCPAHFVKLEQVGCWDSLRSSQPTRLHCSGERETETWELRAVFNALRADGAVAYWYDDMRARSVLSAWLDHLALCAAPPPGVECRTRGLLRKGEFVLEPLSVADARAHLGKLLSLYRTGLREPLRFFPKSAWEYVCIAREGDEDKARKEAFKKWDSGDFPEKNHAAYRLALRGMCVEEVLNEGFRENAETVFGGLWEVLSHPVLKAGDSDCVPLQPS